MKKVVVIIVSILLVVALVIGGIFLFKGNNNEDNVGTLGSETETKNDNDIKNENKNEGNKKEKYQKFDELPNTHTSNATVKYCIDVPSGVLDMDAGGYILEDNILLDKNYFAVFGAYLDIGSEKIYGVDISKIKNSSDILEEMEKQFTTLCSQGLIWADEYSLNIQNKKDVVINDWDMCRYEGTVKLESEYTLDYNSVDFVAYTVIKDGYPVFFAVLDDPEKEEKADLGEIADKIAKTFREYEEE